MRKPQTFARRRLGRAAVMIAIAALLSACAAPDSESTTTSVAGQNTTEGSDGVTTTEPPGSTSDANIIYVVDDDPISLDPAQEGSAQQKQAIGTMFQGLTYMDADLNVQPLLATEWSASPDGLMWTFKLRPDVEFHNGDPVDAEAFKYSIERVLDENNDLRGRRFLDGIVSGVNAPSSDTVEILLETPYGALPSLASQFAMAVVSPRALEELGPEQFGLTPIGGGTGPFVFSEWVAGNRLVVERNPEYWGDPSVPATVTFLTVPEASTRAAMLTTGEADLAEYIAPVDIATLEANPSVEVLQAMALEVRTLKINHLDPRLQDLRVRQALNYGINMQLIIDTVMEGTANVAEGPVPEGVPAALSTPRYTYDPDRAKSLLEEAGYLEPFELKLTYRDDPEIMQAIQAQLNEVGFDIELEQLDADAYSAHNQLEPDDPAAIKKGLTNHGSTYRYPDPYFMQNEYTTDGGSNYGYYSNAEVDQLLSDALGERDVDTRFAMYEQAQELTLDDAALVWLYQRDLIYASTGLEGLVLPTDEVIDFSRISKASS